MGPNVDFWPWWMGAVALSVVTVGWWLTVGRPMGVSASWARLLGVTADAEAERLERALATAPDAVAAALRAATLAEFPELAQAEAAHAPPGSAAPPPIAMRPRLTRSTHLTFLLALGIGGLLAALSRGELALHATLGSGFTRLFPSLWSGGLVLAAGGALVGFGTRMAGGCTSGHALSGVPRFQPASLLATAVFFGTGVATAFALKAVTP